MPVFGTHDKEGNWAVNFLMGAGIQNIPPKTPFCVTIKSNERILEISKRFAKEVSITLNLSQIIDVQERNQKGTYDRQKALNRAAVGGYMLGPVGALIGGSTAGTKSTRYIVIVYRPLNEEAIKEICLEISDATNKPQSFMEALKDQRPQPTQNQNFETTVLPHQADVHFCTNCGNKIVSDSKFCEKCGAAIHKKER